VKSTNTREVIGFLDCWGYRLPEWKVQYLSKSFNVELSCTFLFHGSYWNQSRARSVLRVVCTLEQVCLEFASKLFGCKSLIAYVGWQCVPDGGSSSGKTAWTVRFGFSPRNIKFTMSSWAQMATTSDGGNRNAELYEVFWRLLMETLVDDQTLIPGRTTQCLASLGALLKANVIWS
jgi:hypothetical protein